MGLGTGWLRLGSCALFLLVAIGGGAAQADTAEVESLIRQGVDLRQQGRDERALPLFQKAYDLAPTPRTAGQLGLAEMATGYYLDAEQHLGVALESPDHPWVSKNRKALQETLAAVREHLGEVVVEGTPAGATVTVDKRAAGTLPLSGPVRANSGKITVEISAPGHVTLTKTLTVRGGGRESLSVALEKAATASTQPAPPPAPVAQVASPASPSPPSSTADTSPDDSGRLKRRLGWSAGIGAVAALGFAAVETIVWQGKRSDFNDPVKGCFEDAPMRGAAGCSDVFDSAHSAQTLAIVGYAVGGALGITSAVLLLTGQHQESGGSRVACALSVGTSLVSCRFVF